MAEASIPDDVSADYANDGARHALDAFHATPDYAHLAALLTALRDDYLVVDVTGTRTGGGGKKGARVRTIRSTTGQLVLPIFTSMAELRAAELPVPRAELLALAPDGTQLERALAGLVADGLAVGDAEGGYTLPQS